jgi:hypothetical protein
MRFEARELKSYAEPVTASQLREGEIYFSVQFADESMLIPIVGTWAFAGRNLDPEDEAGSLYFHDVESYRQGVRYDSRTSDDASFQVQTDGSIKHIFEYERALELLMACSLRRKKNLG